MLTVASLPLKREVLMEGTSGQDPHLAVLNQPLEMLLFLNFGATTGNPFHTMCFMLLHVLDSTICAWKLPHQSEGL